jgi:predicted RNA-binding protein YlxR (DUF448 family)
MAEAERTCVVLRAPAPRDELVRLVASPDGEVCVDYRGRAPGRGVWLSLAPEALAGLARAAPRIGAQLGARCDAAELQAQLRAAVVAATGDGLSQAAAAGALILGHDVLVDAVRGRRVEIVAVASDAAERTVSSVSRAGEVLTVRLPWPAAEVGRRVGREVVAVLGVPDATPTAHLRRQLRRLSALG